MLRYAQRRGYELPADLPEAFDPNLNLQTWAISPKDEVSLARQAALAQNTISNTEFDNQVSGALAENTITNTQEDNEREDANTTSLITDRERDNDRSDKYPPNSGGRGGRRAPPGGKQAPAASNKVPAGLPAVTTKDNGRRMRYKTTGEIWTVRNGKWTKE